MKEVYIKDDIFMVEHYTDNLVDDDDVVTIVLPTFNAVEMTLNAVRSFKKFTTIPHQIVVVDNYSNQETIQQLKKEQGINLVLNKGLKKPSPVNAIASFENARGIHIGATFVKTKYMFVAHNDVLACRQGWLKYLLNHFNDKIKGAAFGFDPHPNRIKAMHVSGYLLDWKLYRKSNQVDWFPRYVNGQMRLDVGDHYSQWLHENGYEYFVTPNTHCATVEISKVDNNPENGLLKRHNIFADKATDSSGRCLYLHLGRGFPKSMHQYYKPGRTTYEQWVQFGNNLLNAGSLR